MPPKKSLKRPVSEPGGQNEAEDGAAPDPPAFEPEAKDVPQKIKPLKISGDKAPKEENGWLAEDKLPEVGTSPRKKRVTKKSLKTDSSGVVEEPALREEPSAVSLTPKKAKSKQKVVSTSEGKISRKFPVAADERPLPPKKEPSKQTFFKKIFGKKKLVRVFSETQQVPRKSPSGTPTKDLSKANLTQKISKQKIRALPSQVKIKGQGFLQGSVTKIKTVESTKTLEDLQVAPRLFKYGRSEDEENQKVWSLSTALRIRSCNKKTLISLGVAVFLLIALIVLTVIFARPKGGGTGSSNITSTTTSTDAPVSTSAPSTSVSATMTTKKICPPIQNPNDPVEVGKFCLCDTKTQFECKNCCIRNLQGNSICMAEWTESQAIPRVGATSPPSLASRISKLSKRLSNRKSSGVSSRRRSSRKSIKSGSTTDPSTTSSLTKKKKKSNPEGALAGGRSGSISIAGKPSRKSNKSLAKLTNPKTPASPQPIGSFKQKLIKKLLGYKPVAVHDVENLQGGGPTPSMCTKKSLIIWTILLICLIGLILIIIFTIPRGGNNSTATTSSSAGTSSSAATSSRAAASTRTTTTQQTTKTTKGNCIPTPPPYDQEIIGQYCFCEHGTNKAKCDGCCINFFPVPEDSSRCRAECK